MKGARARRIDYHGATTPPRHRLPLLLLLLAGAVLLASRVDGVFTIDEDSYLVTVAGLRAGRLTVPGTEGLPASPELLSFDAAPRSRSVPATPVASTSPPLYAPLALPFSYLGWPGLVALQVLSFLACIVVVFRMAAMHARRAATPWLAAAAMGLGSFAIEYAQGMWPHMLAAALTCGAAYAAMLLRAGGATRLAALAGVLAGFAVGVRYQNLAIALALAAGLAAFARGRRLRATLAFAAGLAVPLAACAAMNALRLGSWNPVSKGPQYLALGIDGTRGDLMLDALLATWARVVDFGAWPQPGRTLHEIGTFLVKDRFTGEYILFGAMKKALLQSAPWALLALLALARGWRRRARATDAGRELCALSLMVAAVLGMFALYGFRRTDGLTFNQRYLVELMPLLAAAFAMALDEIELSLALIAIATAATAALLAAALLSIPDAVPHIQLLAWGPLGLALCSAAFLLLQPDRARALALAAGACLGWSLTVHLVDDLPASRHLRRSSALRLDAVAAAIPPGEPAALFAWWGDKDALGPLYLDRDVVIVDPWIDHGADAPALTRALLAAGRTVYFLPGVPLPVLRGSLEGLPVTEVETPALRMLRVHPTAR